MGKQKTPKNQTTTALPPAFQVPFLEQLFKRAGESFSTGELGRVAGFTPEQIQSQEQRRQFAASGAGDISQAVTSSFTNLLENALNPQANPQFDAFLQSAIRPIEESLMERILPSIRSGAVQTGNVGSSRQGVAEGQAIRGFSREAGDITSRIVSDAYNRGVQAILQGTALAPAAAEAGMLPANILSSIGGERQGQRQAELDAPFANLSRFQSLVGGRITGGTTTAPAPARPSGLARAAGGALTGSTVGASAGGPVGAGWGAAIGAVAGLAMG